MTARVDVDAGLDSLCEALAAAGLEGPGPPATLTALTALEAAIAPLRLPVEVRRFWERVDAATLRAITHPQLQGPDFALTPWRMARDQFAALQPVALVQVGHSSLQCMSVELTVGEVRGGALFEWSIVDGGFERRFNALGEWLAYVAGLIDAGCFRPVQIADVGQGVLVPDPDRSSEEYARRPVPGAHPVHGRRTHVDRDILEWPEHWQRAAGLRPEDLEPRGATHTITALLATPTSHRVRATIAARVVGLTRSGGWIRVRVNDGTAALDVMCPAATTLLGPRMRDWYEFDIVVEPGERTVPPDPTLRAPASKIQSTTSQPSSWLVMGDRRARPQRPSGA
jgi:hypothetical protein